MKKLFIAALASALIPATVLAQAAPVAPEQGLIKADGAPVSLQEFEDLNALFDACSRQMRFDLDYLNAHPDPNYAPLSATQQKALYEAGRASCFSGYFKSYVSQHPSMAGVRVRNK